MKIDLKLIDSEADIKNKILTSIKDSISEVFSKCISPLKDSISRAVYNAITTEPEYQSLLSGRLQYEFGISESAQRVNEIVKLWTDHVIVEVTPVTLAGYSLKGGFSINMIQDDYSDVLSSSSSRVVDEAKSTVLPWLEWLLLYGNKIIVSNYEVQVGPSPYSRTGLAIMKPSKQNWRVPAEFSGTSSNNWVIRALEKLDNSIPNLIQQEVEKNI
jgi:hypothetical protein